MIADSCRVHLKHYALGSSFVVLCRVLVMVDLSISFRIASQNLEQSYNCPSANQATIKYMRISSITWWRHQMETLSALLALCAGNSPVPGEFPTQRPVTRNFDVFFDLCPNKRLSKQWWFGTLSCPLWRHCKEFTLIRYILPQQYKAWQNRAHILWDIMQFSIHASYCTTHGYWLFFIIFP